MATKRSSKKKTAVKKSAAKKTNPKKIASKKAAPKKAALEKSTTKKSASETEPEESIPKPNLLRSVVIEQPVQGDCMCQQKKLNGKFFCFKLVQGRWVQSSAVPFPTQELCEEFCCSNLF